MKITKSAKKVTASTKVARPQKVVASKNYKAAEDHIMAAIDCLAKESNSDVAKDIIADLSVCLFDVKANTAVKASIELTEEQQDELTEIVEKYTTSNPVSGDWDTETAAEQKDIADAFGLSLDEAKEVMIDYLGFEEDMF